MATLHLVRGLPGSGKSTFAKKLASRLGCKHFEADQFFTDADGNYKFDRAKLGDAHEWCRDSVINEILDGRDVVVSNTFVTENTIRAYLEDEHDPILSAFITLVKFPVIIYEMTGKFQSVHNVPEMDMNRMVTRWESNSDLEKKSWTNPIQFRTVNP